MDKCIFGAIEYDHATRRVGSLSKRSIEKPIDSIINITPKQPVKLPFEKENCSYSTSILLNRKEIAREFALLSANLDKLTGSTEELIEKLTLKDLSCNLRLEKGDETENFAEFQVCLRDFGEELAMAC